MAYRKLSADELITLLKKYNHIELHCHHTWKPNHSHFNGSNHVKLQDGMRNFHMNDNGWDDIAQHVTLFPDGTFLTGRKFGKQPVSIKGYNGSGNRIPFACEMIGDFDKGQDKLEGKQLESMLKLAKFFDDQKKYIRFHRENAPWKTCPGTGIDKNDFMNKVHSFNEVKKADIEEELTVSQAEKLQKEIDELKKVVKQVEVFNEIFYSNVSEINNSVSRVLKRFEQKDPALAAEWREKFLNKELSVKDALGIAYVAFDRGYIQGIPTE